MVVKLDVLDGQLDQIKKIIGSSSIQNKVTEAFDQAKALNTPLVGKVVGEVNNGIKGLDTASTDFDDIGSKLALGLKNGTAVLQNLQHQVTGLQSTAAQLTGELPGIGEKLAVPLDTTNKSTASAITGTEVKESFTGIVFAAATAAALGSAVKKMGDGIEASEVGSIIESAVGKVDINLKANLPKDLVSQLELPNIDLNLSSVTSKLDEAAGGVFKGIKENLPTITDLPVLDTLHKLNNSTSIVTASFNFPAGLTGDLNPKNIAKNVLASMANNNLNEAENYIKSVIPGIPELDLSLTIGGLNLSLGSVGAVLEDPISALGIEQTNTVNGVANVSKKYSVVNSLEEIKAEIQNSQRDIKYTIWHWSETHENEIVTAENIAKNNGGVIDYHYIIRKNGSIQRGEIIGNPTASVGDAEYDENSISVLVVGGYMSDLDEAGDFKINSVNSIQQKSLAGLIGVIYEILPGNKMYSHAEIDENVSSSEPGVNIQALIKTKYNKENEKAPVVVRTHTGNEEGTLSAKPGVIFAHRGATFRNKDPQQQLVDILSAVAQAGGYTIEIFSAGQMPYDEWASYPSSQREKKGSNYYLNGKPVRMGSVRHDNGWAVDVRVYNTFGQPLDFAVDENAAEIDPNILVVLGLLQQYGITAFGAGPGYMIEGSKSKYPGNGNLHIDIANGRNATTGATVWGRGGKYDNAPYWLKYQLGKI